MILSSLRGGYEVAEEFVHHLSSPFVNPDNVILISGYQAEGSREDNYRKVQNIRIFRTGCSREGKSIYD
jgi:hypothetical protein